MFVIPLMHICGLCSAVYNLNPSSVYAQEQFLLHSPTCKLVTWILVQVTSSALWTSSCALSQATISTEFISKFNT
ncbi:hypothetical protein FB451DRAFT_1398074 [Mycena latifolia]|nr:hypothetical protein FB451DRAFT_1398074 [Mycena latifolia]